MLEDDVFYIESEERGARSRSWMFRQLSDAEKCLLLLNREGTSRADALMSRWHRRGLHPRASLSKPDPDNFPGRVSVAVDGEPIDRGWMGATHAILLSHALALSPEQLELELRQDVPFAPGDSSSGEPETGIASPESQADPQLNELVSRWQKWRRIYAYAGQPAHDEPVWESGQLHLRHGYPFPGWTSYIVEAADGGYYVMTATTERRNNPLEGSAGFFTHADDAGKYIIWNIGEDLRLDCRLDPIAWAWEDGGLDVRVHCTPRAEFVSRYELISDPSRYFILRAGGIQPENHLLPLTYDELESQLLDGMPETWRGNHAG
ncbi:hypothetical protein B5P44_30205 [Mycobacterium sp. CBMA 213]|nr:hypothetical protein [Mycolicibacterium sp. CBMA 213]